jgi:hypothetical protein
MMERQSIRVRIPKVDGGIHTLEFVGSSRIHHLPCAQPFITN